jgi:hypothetical protein
MHSVWWKGEEGGPWGRRGYHERGRDVSTRGERMMIHEVGNIMQGQGRRKTDMRICRRGKEMKE